MYIRLGFTDYFINVIYIHFSPRKNNDSILLDYANIEETREKNLAHQV